MHPELSSSQSALNFCPGKQPVVLQETGGSAAFAKTYFEPETRRDSVIEWQRGWEQRGRDRGGPASYSVRLGSLGSAEQDE